MANKTATMTDVWKYFAGDTLTSVPAALTADQKAAYRIANFRNDWAALSDVDKEWFKAAVQELMPA